METSTLDGEKHLKQRESLELIRSKIKVADSTDSLGQQKFNVSMDLNLRLFVQHPNPSLYNFEGFVDFKDMPAGNLDSNYQIENLENENPGEKAQSSK